MALSATYLKWSPAFLVVESMPICLYGILETPTTVSSITMKVIWAFAEDHGNQNGPCLKSIACTSPELCKQTFATSERE